MIEKQEVLAATCGGCGHVDYAPVGYEERLPGFQVIVVHQDMQEKAYVCKVVHVGRAAKLLAEKLKEDFGDQESEKPDVESTDSADGTDDDRERGSVSPIAS